MHKELIVPENLKANVLFKNIFVKKGNSERSLNFLMQLHTFLRISVKRRIIRVQGGKRNYPPQVLDKLLYKLKPAFIIRRVIAAGKPYMLPVPISDHRALYLACSWMRKAILQDTKGAATIPQLMLREILNLSRNKGLAVQALSDYIKLAIDQRPFSRFIRRKFKKRSRQYHRIYTNRARKLWRARRKPIRLNRRRTRWKTKRFSAVKKLKGKFQRLFNTKFMDNYMQQRKFRYLVRVANRKSLKANVTKTHNKSPIIVPKYKKIHVQKKPYKRRSRPYKQ
jgi:ribosomal protein S7